MASGPAAPVRRRTKPYDRRFSCDYPDCHKAFTRAEHLSRHRQNHFPDRIYTCRECERKFVRADLLQRHTERHEKHQERARPQQPEMAMHSPAPSSASSAYVHHQPMFGSDSFTDTPYAMNDEFMTWLFNDHCKFGHLAAPELALNPGIYMLPEIGSLTLDPQSAPHIVSEHCRLEVIATLSALPDLMRNPYIALDWLQQYLDNYWMLFAPHYAIVHPGTSAPDAIQPVLLIAMLTIGAAYCHDPHPHALANTIQDKLRWIVFGVSVFAHSDNPSATTSSLQQSSG
ncbi:Zinc finger protein [Neolecta irregularis DAH-3]|uniref:Zinc finger protein n=1 Tax=Neolecta irregularis (strain DAH-3) TaxID=1198029 RepID=A0A1U7LPZ7_NEOID|nr:Zinc finger protein [Neolecta irregularis DAH-3]|eukprot:OLL24735.1 Zinc finger protein [Neolecta irregularis DAH-3]